MNSLRFLPSCLCLFLLAPMATAQEEGANPDMEAMKELIQQIRRNMVEVEKDIDRVESESAKTAAEQVQKDIQKLIDQMKGRGQQITKDIDELVKKIPEQGGGGGGGGGQKSQSQSQSQGSKNQSKSGKERDRNNPENQGQQPKPDQGEQTGDQKGGKRKTNTGKDDEKSNERASAREQREKKIKADLELLEGRWGTLPAELRQKLIERNFKEFTPEYQEELKAYFKKLLEQK